MTAQAATLTAADMLSLLKRHYLPDPDKAAGVFAAEIQAPGRSARRADLIWHGVTAATGRELIGHEIKVSRADLLTELQDQTKSHDWQRFCDRWYLVVSDPKLVDGLDLPPTWGVLAPPSGRRTRSMTVVLKAPKLRPDDQATALRTLMAWQHWKWNRDAAELSRRDASVRALRTEVEQLRRLVPGRQSTQSQRTREVVNRIVDALGGVQMDGEIGSWHNTVSVDDVIAVLRDVKEANGLVSYARGNLESLRSQLRHMGRQVDHVLKETA